MNERGSRVLQVVALALVVLICSASGAEAGVIHVNNRHGQDVYDGAAPRPLDRYTGPVRSIGRSLELANPGDTIVVANTGVPYYESFSLVGGRHSGSPSVRFTIEGNGAVVSGARAVPAAAWRQAAESLWQMTPRRKGYYQLLLDGETVPEFRPTETVPQLSQIPQGRWTARRGSIYYHGRPGERPGERGFAYAHFDVGLTLYNVRHVVVRDLTFRHFRLDGMNAHDGCRDVTLENVTCSENGRAGLVAAGTSRVRLRNCKAAGNRHHSLLVSERAEADLEETELSVPATVAD